MAGVLAQTLYEYSQAEFKSCQDEFTTVYPKTKPFASRPSKGRVYLIDMKKKSKTNSLKKHSCHVKKALRSGTSPPHPYSCPTLKGFQSRK